MQPHQSQHTNALDAYIDPHLLGYDNSQFFIANAFQDPYDYGAVNRSSIDGAQYIVGSGVPQRGFFPPSWQNNSLVPYDDQSSRFSSPPTNDFESCRSSLCTTPTLSEVGDLGGVSGMPQYDTVSRTTPESLQSLSYRYSNSFPLGGSQTFLPNHNPQTTFNGPNISAPLLRQQPSLYPSAIQRGFANDYSLESERAHQESSSSSAGLGPISRYPTSNRRSTADMNDSNKKDSHPFLRGSYVSLFTAPPPLIPEALGQPSSNITEVANTSSANRPLSSASGALQRRSTMLSQRLPSGITNKKGKRQAAKKPDINIPTGRELPHISPLPGTVMNLACRMVNPETGDRCSEPLESFADFRQHLMKVHDIKDSHGRKDQVRCQWEGCHKGTFQAGALFRHTLSHAAMYQCPFDDCAWESASARDDRMKKHLNKMHNISARLTKKLDWNLVAYNPVPISSAQAILRE